jgi:hypothetical protein
MDYKKIPTGRATTLDVKQKLKQALRDKRPYTKASKEQWTQHFLSMIADNNTSYQQLYPLRPIAATPTEASGSRADPQLYPLRSIAATPTESSGSRADPPSPPTINMVSPIAQQVQQAAETVKRRLEQPTTTSVKRKRVRARRSRLIPPDDIFSVL